MASHVYFLAFVLVATYAAPEESPVSIEALENGQFYANTRIVGGENAPEGSVPWMAGMSTGYVIRSFVCGASIVSERHILTAAHCIDAVYISSIITGGSLATTLRIHVGSNRWSSDDTRYSLAGNLTHPHWTSRTIKNDLGFLITDERITFDELVRPVALNFEPVPGGTTVMAAGWGRVRAGGSLALNLQRVFLTALDGDECIERVHQFAADNNYINVPSIEPHIELCTFKQHGKGTCNGDSGSALVLAGRAEQIGAVSWGFPCAIGAPDMFASLAGNKQFIKESLAVIL